MSDLVVIKVCLSFAKYDWAVNHEFPLRCTIVSLCLSIKIFNLMAFFEQVGLGYI